MLAHALDILQNELTANLASYHERYSDSSDELSVTLGNMATIAVNAEKEGNQQTDIVVTLVNLKEERSLKNVPNYVRDDVNLRVRYENPPVFVNAYVLFTVVCNNYSVALSALSRLIRFFQAKNVFTHDNVRPNFLSPPLIRAEDRLETFKLILDLYSPTFEEINHLWGTLGGKQYPHALYVLRMLDLKYAAVQQESGLITEVSTEYFHRQPFAK